MISWTDWTPGSTGQRGLAAWRCSAGCTCGHSRGSCLAPRGWSLFGSGTPGARYCLRRSSRLVGACRPATGRPSSVRLETALVRRGSGRVGEAPLPGPQCRPTMADPYRPVRRSLPGLSEGRQGKPLPCPRTESGSPLRQTGQPMAPASQSRSAAQPIHDRSMFPPIPRRQRSSVMASSFPIRKVGGRPRRTVGAAL